jgi:heat shock protein HtpX
MSQVDGLYGHIQRNIAISRGLILWFFASTSVCWILICVVYRLAFGNQYPADLHTSPEFAAIAACLKATNCTRPELVYLGAVKGLYSLYQVLFFVAAWFVLFWYGHMALWSWATGAEPVTRKDERRFYDIVEVLSIQTGQPMPGLEVIESPAMNAYAAGMNPENSVIGVTRGLLDQLNDRELRAVVAHEYTHIQNGDSRVMMVAAIFVGVYETLFHLMKIMFTPAKGPEPGHSPLLIPIAIIMFAPACLCLAVCWLPSILGRAALSRRREFLADAGAVELTKDADALVSALIKITGYAVPLNLPGNYQAMMITSATDSLFASHPPVEERIAALQAHAGARVPIPRRADGRFVQPGQHGQRATFGRRSA